MKANLFKKSREMKNSSFEEMNNQEMKTIQGGVKEYLVRNPDGSYSVIIVALD